jgi:hypothetical protein
VKGVTAETLDALEEAVGRALASEDAGDLRVLGYGEISLVVAWPTPDGERAFKRLPVFPDQASFERYRRNVERYLERLRSTGVEPVETEVLSRRKRDGRVVGYVVQPVLPEESLLPRRLARCEAAEARMLLTKVLDAVEPCASKQLGLDAQLSNWVWLDERLLHLDVSTPLMRDEAGKEQLDVELFIAALPWALRGVVRRFMLGAILDKYYDLRDLIIDVLGNMYKEQLDRWVPALIELANRRLDRSIAEDEVRKYYRSDARMWALLLWLRRADRFWQRRIRRRTYPYLLPGRIERHV